MATRSIGALTVDLILKMGGWKDGMDQSARTAEKSLKRIQSAARGIGTAVAAGFAGLGAANLFGAMIRNTIEAEDALAQLDARLKSTGGVAGVTSEQIVSFAKSMQSVTTFGDDAIISMNALLLSFTNIRGDRVFGATEAILDFAAALKTDLPSAAQTVGRALNDPIRGIALLRRSGIEFTKDQENLIKALVKTGDVAAAQGIILDKLSTKYGGSAAAAADTFGGALEQLKNAFGELLEADGEGINGATGAIQELTKVLQDPATVAAAQALTGGIASAFQFLVEDIAKGVNAIREFGKDIDAMRFGPAADDVARLTERLRQATETRDSFLDPVKRTELFGPKGIIEFWNDAELDAEITRLQGLIKAATRNTAAAGFGGMAAGLFKAGQPAVATGSTAAVDSMSKAIAGLDALLAEQAKTTEAAAKSQEQLRLSTIAAGQALTESFQTPLEKYNAAVKEADRLLAAKVITVETWAQALGAARGELDSLSSGMLEVNERFKDMNQELEESLEHFDEDMFASLTEMEPPDISEALGKVDTQLSVFADQAARNTQDIIADGLVNGFDDGIKGMLDSFVDMLAKMAAQAVAADIAKKLFGNPEEGSSGGGGGGWLGAAIGFFTSRDSGGRGQAGVPYMIGTGAQPELFVPDSAGEFYPKGSQGGGMKLVQNFHFSSPADRHTQTQVGAAAGRGVQNAQRRNG